MMTGRCVRRMIMTTSSSSGESPVDASTTKTSASAWPRGELRLSAGSARDLVAVGAGVDAGRVDQREGAAAPLRQRVEPIARDARRIVDDRQAAPDQPVEERTLSPHWAAPRLPRSRAAARAQAPVRGRSPCRSPSARRTKGPGSGLRRTPGRCAGPFEYLVACGILALAARAGAAAQAAAGGMYVSTLPADADVWVDGAYIGRSPLLIEGLGEGRHALTVTKAGWVSQELVRRRFARGRRHDGRPVERGRDPSGDCCARPGAYILRKLPDGPSATDRRPTRRAREQRGAARAGHPPLAVTTAKGSVVARIRRVPRHDDGACAAGRRAQGSRRMPRSSRSCSDFLPDGSYSSPAIAFPSITTATTVPATSAPRPCASTARPCRTSGAGDIGGRLYLPVALLEKLTGKSAKSK